MKIESQVRNVTNSPIDFTVQNIDVKSTKESKDHISSFDGYSKASKASKISMPNEDASLINTSEISKSDIKKLNAAREFFEKNPISQPLSDEQKQHMLAIRDVLEKIGITADTIPQGMGATKPTPEQFNEGLRNLTEAVSNANNNGEKNPIAIGIALYEGYQFGAWVVETFL